MRNLTLKQLRYVEGADRLGSITNAADEMNISQSSITAAINMLEDSLGHDVFIRTPAKGIHATATGREAMALIRRFIYQSRQFEEELSSLGGEAMGTVRIGCYATAAPSFLPTILQAISEEFPDASIQLLEGNLARVMEFLHEGDIDVAFTYKESIDAQCEFTSLFSAPPYAIVALNDPLAQQDSTSLEELIDRPMVLLDLPQTQDYFMRLFSVRGLSPTIAHSSRSSEIVPIADGAAGRESGARRQLFAGASDSDGRRRGTRVGARRANAARTRRRAPRVAVLQSINHGGPTRVQRLLRGRSGRSAQSDRRRCSVRQSDA